MNSDVIAINVLQTTACQIVRDHERMIRTPERILEFCVVLEGSCELSQLGRSTRIASAEPALIISTAQWAQSISAPAVLVEVRIPLDDLGPRADLLADFVGGRLPPAPLRNAALAYVEALSEKLPDPSSAAALYVERALRAMIIALLAELVDATIESSPDTDLRLRIADFIAANLSDPELDASGVARAFEISRAKLYRLFADQDQSVARFIRDARLSFVARTLGAPLSPPIGILARQAGFRGPDQMTRLFRTQYGQTPQQFRRAVRHAPDTAAVSVADATAAVDGDR